MNVQTKKNCTGYETKCGDDQITDTDVEETFPRSATGTVEADLLKNDILVQVDTIETIETKVRDEKNIRAKEFTLCRGRTKRGWYQVGF